MEKEMLAPDPAELYYSFDVLQQRKEIRRLINKEGHSSIVHELSLPGGINLDIILQHLPYQWQ